MVVSANQIVFGMDSNLLETRSRWGIRVVVVVVVVVIEIVVVSDLYKQNGTGVKLGGGEGGEIPPGAVDGDPMAVLVLVAALSVVDEGGQHEYADHSREEEWEQWAERPSNRLASHFKR